jgi:hypothetical protein
LAVVAGGEGNIRHKGLADTVGQGEKVNGAVGGAEGDPFGTVGGSLGDLDLEDMEIDFFISGGGGINEFDAHGTGGVSGKEIASAAGKEAHEAKESDEKGMVF